jgi:hypothetical protein
MTFEEFMKTVQKSKEEILKTAPLAKYTYAPEPVVSKGTYIMPVDPFKK